MAIRIPVIDGLRQREDVYAFLSIRDGVLTLETHVVRDLRATGGDHVLTWPPRGPAEKG